MHVPDFKRFTFTMHIMLTSVFSVRGEVFFWENKCTCFTIFTSSVVSCLMLIAGIKGGCSQWHGQSTQFTQIDHLSTQVVMSWMLCVTAAAWDTKMETAKTSLWVNLSLSLSLAPYCCSNISPKATKYIQRLNDVTKCRATSHPHTSGSEVNVPSCMLLWYHSKVYI